MAIAYAGSLGSLQNKTSEGSTVVTLTAGASIGDLVVLSVAADDTTGYSVTDSRGNTWSNYPAGLTGEISAYAFWSTLTTALLTSDTITVSWAGSPRTAKAILVDRFTGALGTVDTPNIGADGTAASFSVAKTTTHADVMLMGVLALEGPGTDVITDDADTDGGDTWHNATLATSGGGAASNARVYRAYKIVSTTGTYTFNPANDTNRDYGIVLVAFKGPLPSSAGRPLPRRRTLQAVHRSSVI